MALLAVLSLIETGSKGLDTVLDSFTSSYVIDVQNILRFDSLLDPESLMHCPSQ